MKLLGQQGNNEQAPVTAINEDAEADEEDVHAESEKKDVKNKDDDDENDFFLTKALGDKLLTGRPRCDSVHTVDDDEEDKNSSDDSFCTDSSGDSILD